MNITYLTKAKNWAEKNPRLVMGVSESEIAAAEEKSGIPFPAAYKEFLFIGGNIFRAVDGVATDLEWLSDEIWPDLDQYLTDVDVDLGRQILVIGEENGTLVFVYPDEGDNPPVWVCEPDDKNGEDWLRRVNDSISDYFDFWIDLYDDVHRPRLYDRLSAWFKSR